MNQRGFTAVELAAVAVISGILLAFTIPAVVTYRATLKGSQARDQLIQDLRAARQKAVTQHSTVVVAFGDGVATTNITSYTVHTDSNGDRLYQSTEPRATHSMPQETRLAAVSLSPPDSLIFDISGILHPGTTGGYLVCASRSRMDTLLVSAAGMVYRQ